MGIAIFFIMIATFLVVFGLLLFMLLTASLSTIFNIPTDNTLLIVMGVLAISCVVAIINMRHDI